MVFFRFSYFFLLFIVLMIFFIMFCLFYFHWFYAFIVYVFLYFIIVFSLFPRKFLNSTAGLEFKEIRLYGSKKTLKIHFFSKNNRGKKQNPLGCFEK